MTKLVKNFYSICKITSVIGAVCVLMFCTDSFGATARRTVAASRTSAAPATGVAARKTNTTNKTKSETVAEPTPQTEPVIVENKADKFDTALNDIDSAINTSETDSVTDAINRRRAEIKKQEMTQAASVATKQAFARNENACDKTLRQCIQTTCGSNYEKCTNLSETDWLGKMNQCRRETSCTNHEYNIFVPEITADRDVNAKLGLYNKIVDCGNRFNDCVISECGKTMEKCISKQNGDAALNKCKQISQECQEADSGLSARANNAFTQLRQVAEKQITIDEQRLYELRNKMNETCKRMGALFDERTLDCIYTIEFWGGEDNTLFASRKAYPGTQFNCDQNWFGVDTTTFMENAFRLTRSQTSASSAMLGAGLGMGVGSITSGAIDRAVDRAKAERALGDKLCTSTGGTWNKTINTCKCPDGAKFDDESGCQTDEAAAKKAKEKEEKQKAKEEKKAKKEADKQAKSDKLKSLCETAGAITGTWDADKEKCTCPNDGTTYFKFDKTKGCVKDDQRTEKETAAQKAKEQKHNQENCTKSGNEWLDDTCKCKDPRQKWNATIGTCAIPIN